MNEVENIVHDSGNLERPIRTREPEENREGVVVAGPVRTREQLKRAVAEFDDETFAMLMKNADILEKAGDYRLALNILRSILMRRPDDLQALERMGRCLKEEGRYEEALKCYRALTRLGKKLDAQISMAEIYYLSERDELALATYRDVLKNVIEDQDRLFEIYKNVGNIHVRAGDFDAAQEFYDKAYTIRPNSDILMVNYGTLEIQRENLGEAVERFRRAVELNPENDRAWVGLAMVHRQMGDHELAWANGLRALDINKGNRTAVRLIVEWGVMEHKFSDAIRRLQEYLEIDGEDAEMSFTLAKLFTQVGRLAEARLEIERVLALDPGMEGAEALRAALDKELQKRSL